VIVEATTQPLPSPTSTPTLRPALGQRTLAPRVAALPSCGELAAALFVVRQYGPRRLWDETETAYRWWHEVGEPLIGSPRFGLTLTLTHTSQTLWLDTPATPVRHWELDTWC
jgi:hypothetical protein